MKKIDSAEKYARIIMEDDLNQIAWEETLDHGDDYIAREYEITDGAFIKYEWRSFPGKSANENYNHRFTLVTPPKKNPDKLKPGIIYQIDHPKGGR